MSEPIVTRAREATQLEHGAALVLEPLRRYLDEVGLGRGELSAQPIGDGHSNLTFLIERGDERFVLRRPPRGELAPSANDVIREARVLEALDATALPLPSVLAQCDDPEVIGAPFFVMDFIGGSPINDGLPAELDQPGAPQTISDAVVSALVTLHDADLETSGLSSFGRRSGYLQRQLELFGSLLDRNKTRPLPDLDAASDWLSANLPTSPESTFVHGDFRLGNLLFAAPLHLAAVLDWEMATVGDPLADLGYCVAMWTEAGDAPNPMFALSRLTQQPGFPGRAEIARRYAERTGRSLELLPWYEVFALWKSAIFLEGSHRRHVNGASQDPYFSSLADGVPALAGAVAERIRRYERAARAR